MKRREFVVVLYYVVPIALLVLGGYLAGGTWLWILGFIAILWPLGNVAAAMVMGSD